MQRDDRRAAARHGEAHTREAGLALIKRANRWIVSAAVVLAAGISAVTAHAFHARTAVSSTVGDATPSTSAPRPRSGDGDGDHALRSPSQAPAAAPAPTPTVAAPSPVVSGGS